MSEGFQLNLSHYPRQETIRQRLELTGKKPKLPLPSTIMQLATLLAVALLPLGLMAAPVMEATGTTEARDLGTEIFKRSPQICRIVNTSSTVNCRKGPGTQYGVLTTFQKGERVQFSCVKSGECITDNGTVNWYVL